jgi:hypothetical protein
MTFTMDLRGSGVYSYDEEVAIECECGSTEGTRFVDDWKVAVVTCDNCQMEQPEEDDEDPDYARDLWLEQEYEDRY